VAMVYLLHRYFGEMGVKKRKRCWPTVRRFGQSAHSGGVQRADSRLAGVFHVHILYDRDGKFQLCSLAESGFDPLARTCRFMLTEEAHHMFVGRRASGGSSNAPAK